MSMDRSGRTLTGGIGLLLVVGVIAVLVLLSVGFVGFRGVDVGGDDSSTAPTTAPSPTSKSPSPSTTAAAGPLHAKSVETALEVVDDRPEIRLTVNDDV